MLKTIVCAAGAMFFVQVAQAEDAYEPRLQTEVFGTFLQAKGDPADPTYEGLNLKGGGYGARVTGSISSAQFWVEGALQKPKLNDVFEDGANDVLKISFRQIRAGIRGVSFSSGDSPVYSSIGAEYLNIHTKSSLIFGPTTTEDQAGEDPAADPDTIANTQTETDGTDYGLARLRVGYRTKAVHFYGDVGYGASPDDGRVLDFLGGISYGLLENVSLFGEYRQSEYRDKGDSASVRDLRVGIGANF